MKTIPKNKAELYEFINKEFPGSWKEYESCFELSIFISDKDSTISHNIVFYHKDKFMGDTAIFLLERKNYWRYNLSFEEIKIFYKKYYKMRNFK